jgi:hypothetical protein
MSVILRRRKLPSGHVSLLIEVNKDGKQMIESLHLILTGDRLQDRETLKQAKAIRDMRAVEQLERKFGPAANPNRKSPSFADYAEKLVKWREPRTRKSTTAALIHLTRCLGDNLLFSEIGRNEVRKFRDYLLTCKGLSANSALRSNPRFQALVAKAERTPSP